MLLTLALIASTHAAAAPTPPPPNLTYIFFKKESARVDATALDVLRRFVASESPAATGCTIHIEASSEIRRFERHAETVSQRRAIATRSALLALGMAATRIRFDWGVARAPLEPNQDRPSAMNRYARLSWIEPCG